MKDDPIGLNGGINYYRYVNNNPIGVLDSNGLYCVYIHFGTKKRTRLIASTPVVLFGHRGLPAWRFQVLPQTHLSVNPAGILNKILKVLHLPQIAPIISNISGTGVAECHAIRSLVYDNVYVEELTSVTEEICCDKCLNCHRKNWTSTSVSKQWIERQTKHERDPIVIKVKAPVELLANIVCTEWLDSLNHH